MSKRAEQFARKLYTPWSEDGMSRKDNSDVIEACIKGYEQAEKDLELTGEDARLMVAAFFYVIENHTRSQTLVDQSDLYEDVLKRFNEQRKK